MKARSQFHIQPWYLFHYSQNTMLFGLFLLVVSLEVTKSGSLVKTLPGFPGDLPFQLETGYILVGDSDDVQFFYYFFESERNPENDPLLVWVRGGPGCSVLTSILLQTGPITLNFANSSLENPILELSTHSLTKVANIIYLDEPAGSGFSYAKSLEASTSNDTLTAFHVHQFVSKWLVDHPKFVNNPFYVGGDSYGGILVPMTLLEMYNGNEGGEKPHINIKGYMLGNPLTNIHSIANSKIQQFHRMALISDRIYESVKKNCHGEYVNVDPNNTLCIHDLQVVEKCVERIEVYNVLKPACDPLDSSMDIGSLDELQIQWRCNSATAYTEAWANRREVQEALHISEDFNGIKWVVCNKSLTFGDEPIKYYKNNVLSTVPYHQQLSQKKCRALVYSGDHDTAASYLDTRKWIESINLLLVNYWRPWYVDEQVAGYTMKYSNNDYQLTFATVKGGSHTCPENRPKECSNMFMRWLANEEL